jgi:hypothetical protein
MEYYVLISLHIAFGILWAGGAIVLGFFVVPSVLEAGPAAGPVMAGVTKRKLPLVMTISGTIVVLTGLRLYMMRFAPAWLGTPQGIVLTIGALLALGAYVMGVFVQRPTAERLGALGAQLAKSGAPPSPAQAAEMQALRSKLGSIARLTSWHLVGAAGLMSIHRLAATW